LFKVAEKADLLVLKGGGGGERRYFPLLSARGKKGRTGGEGKKITIATLCIVACELREGGEGEKEL